MPLVPKADPPSNIVPSRVQTAARSEAVLSWLAEPLNRLGRHLEHPSYGAALGAFLSLLILFPLLWLSDGWYQRQLLARARSEAHVEVSLRANALDSAINRHLAHIQGLASFVRADADMPAFDARFSRYADELLVGADGVLAILAAPGGRIAHVHPAWQAGSFLGYDLIRDWRQVPEASRSSGVRQHVFGPTRYPQGAWSLVLQEEVLDERGRYWGHVSLLLDVQTLLQEADLTVTAGDLTFAIRNDSGGVIYGTSSVLGENPVISRIPIPGGYWDLLAAPEGSWMTVIREPLMVFRSAGLIIIGLLIGLTYLAIERQTRLMRLVADRTHELSQTNKRLERDLHERKRIEAALREREEQARSIFESVTDGLFINDLDGRLVDFNPAAAHMHGYSVEEFRQLQPPQFIHPDSIPLFEQYMDAIRAGNQFRTRAVDLRKDGTPFHIDVFGTPFTYRGRPATLAVVRDVTEEVEAFRLLEARVRERTQELTTLLDLGRNLAATHEVEPLFGQILDQLRVVVTYTGAAISELEEDSLVVKDYRGPLPREIIVARRFSTRYAVDHRIVHSHEPVLIDDVHGDSELAVAFRAALGEEFTELADGVRSWLGVPLIVKDQVIGMLALDHVEPNYYTESHAELAIGFANQVAVAIENTRLLDAEQVRRRQADTLLQVASVVASTLELEEVLYRILDQLRQVVHYDSGSVQLLRADEKRVEVVAGRHYQNLDRFIGMSFPLNDEHPNKLVIEYARPLNLVDAPEAYETFRETKYAHIRGWLGVPLRIQDRVVGMITLDRWQPGGFTPEEIKLASAFADLAALAMENARLYERAHELAAAEERNRLARDLHDSASQSLYSLTLFAEAARRAAQAGELSQVDSHLVRVRETAQQSLREMRLLVHQLRAPVLEELGLTGALQQRLDAVEKRSGVQAELASIGDQPLPPTVEDALFGIAQEALNNALKHAAATRVWVRVVRGTRFAELEVGDDGRGFDPDKADLSGGAGLVNMQERAQQLEGRLQLLSHPEGGTVIRVRIPLLKRIEPSLSEESTLWIKPSVF